MKKNKMGMMPPGMPEAPARTPASGKGHRAATTGKKTTVRMIVTIEGALVDAVDELIGNLPIQPSRSFWVVEAIQEKLARANEEIASREKAKAEAFLSQGVHR